MNIAKIKLHRILKRLKESVLSERERGKLSKRFEHVKNVKNNLSNADFLARFED